MYEIAYKLAVNSVRIRIRQIFAYEKRFIENLRKNIIPAPPYNSFGKRDFTPLTSEDIKNIDAGWYDGCRYARKQLLNE